MKLSYLAWLPCALAFKYHTPDASNQDYGLQMNKLIQELTVALPLVLVNLSNASGLLHAGTLSHEITYHPGNVSHDLAFVTDKAAGFYGTLGDFMRLEQTDKDCAPGVPQNIMRCLHVSACIIQSGVSAGLVGMDVFSGLLEQVVRFEEIAWPNLREALMEEKGGNLLADDLGQSEDYSCDGSVEEGAGTGGNLLQTASDSEALQAGSLGMSAALHGAMRASHRLLDAHGVNTSMHDTIQALHKTWHRVCKELECDHTNYWDVFLRHHRHSMALLDTRHVALLRADIRKRFQLQHRLQRFISTHHQDYSFVQSYARFGQEQASSEGIFHDYHKRSKKALMDFVMPAVYAMDEARAVRLVDREVLRALDEEAQDGSAGHAVQHEEGEDEDSADSADSDQVEEASPAPLDASNGTAVMLLEEKEGEGEGSASGRRRWSRRRRRRRRRRRFWDKVGNAIVKGATAVGKGIVKVAKAVYEGLKCIGATVRFINTGYSRSLGTHVAWNMGLNAGTSEAMLDLFRGQIPYAWTSISTGFAVGSVSDWWWAGSGMSGGVGCSSASGCSLSINVALLGCAISSTPWSTACPFSKWLEKTWKLKCGHSAGWAVSIFCCSFNLHNGQHSCR